MGRTMFVLSKLSNGSSLSFKGPPAWGMLGSVADGSAMSLHSHDIMFGSLIMTSHRLGPLSASSSAISAARPSPPPKSPTDAAGCPAGRRRRANLEPRAEKCCSWAAVAKVAGLTTSPVSLRISTSRSLVRHLLDEGGFSFFLESNFDGTLCTVPEAARGLRLIASTASNEVLSS